MSRTGRQLFVYWRVTPGDEAQALAALADAQARLQADRPGLRTCRFERIGGPPTLMETYAADGGIDPSTQQAIERRVDAATARWRAGERHVEVFEPR